jgi:hypothetical protein
VAKIVILGREVRKREAGSSAHGDRAAYGECRESTGRSRAACAAGIPGVKTGKQITPARLC